MKEQLENRLAELEAEYQKGETQLQDLDQQRSNLRETLLRISGAIQVLKEEVQKAGGAAPVAQEVTENGQG